MNPVWREEERKGEGWKKETRNGRGKKERERGVLVGKNMEI